MTSGATTHGAQLVVVVVVVVIVVVVVVSLAVEVVVVILVVLVVVIVVAIVIVIVVVIFVVVVPNGLFRAPWVFSCRTFPSFLCCEPCLSRRRRRFCPHRPLKKN